MSNAILINFLNVNIYNFYTDEVLLDIIFIPVVITIYAIWNALNDPLFGSISDRTRTKIGRRFPYIVFGFIPLIASFILLWYLPQSITITNQSIVVVAKGNIPLLWKNTVYDVWLHYSPYKLFAPFMNKSIQYSIFAYMVSFLLIFDTLFTIVFVSWSSLFPEKFKTEKQRNHAAAVRQTLNMLGSVIAIVIPPLLIQYGNIDSYRLPIMILVIAAMVGFLLSIYGIRDYKKNNNETEKEIESTTEAEKLTFKKSLSTVLSNRNFLAFMVTFSLSQIAFLTLMAVIRYVNKWILLERPQFETYFSGIAFGMGLLTFIVWAKISIKRGPKFVYIVSGALFSIALFPLIFSKEGWQWVVLAVMFFVGFSISGLLLVPDVLISQVIDKDIEDTGKRREGIFYGFYGFAMRIAIVFQSYFVTIVLKATKYDPYAATQNNLAKIGIKILLVGVPAFCFIIGILAMIFFYDLSRKKLEEKHGRKFSKFF
jgi:GPH family glycoside/pentoside/hexuronide:cation symporter